MIRQGATAGGPFPLDARIASRHSALESPGAILRGQVAMAHDYYRENVDGSRVFPKRDKDQQRRPNGQRQPEQRGLQSTAQSTHDQPSAASAHTAGAEPANPYDPPTQTIFARPRAAALNPQQFAGTGAPEIGAEPKGLGTGTKVIEARSAPKQIGS